MHSTVSLALAALFGFSSASLPQYGYGNSYPPFPVAPHGTGVPPPPKGTGLPQPPQGTGLPYSPEPYPSVVSTPCDTSTLLPPVQTWSPPPHQLPPPASTVTVTVTATETKVVGYTYCPTGNYPHQQNGNQGGAQGGSPADTPSGGEGQGQGQGQGEGEGQGNGSIPPPPPPTIPYTPITIIPTGNPTPYQPGPTGTPSSPAEQAQQCVADWNSCKQQPHANQAFCQSSATGCCAAAVKSCRATISGLADKAYCDKLEAQCAENTDTTPSLPPYGGSPTGATTSYGGPTALPSFGFSAKFRA